MEVAKQWGCGQLQGNLLQFGQLRLVSTVHSRFQRLSVQPPLLNENTLPVFTIVLGSLHEYYFCYEALREAQKQVYHNDLIPMRLFLNLDTSPESASLRNSSVLTQVFGLPHHLVPRCPAGLDVFASASSQQHLGPSSVLCWRCQMLVLAQLRMGIIFSAEMVDIIRTFESLLIVLDALAGAGKTQFFMVLCLWLLVSPQSLPSNILIEVVQPTRKMVDQFYLRMCKLLPTPRNICRVGFDDATEIDFFSDYIEKCALESDCVDSRILDRLDNMLINLFLNHGGQGCDVSSGKYCGMLAVRHGYLVVVAYQQQAVRRREALQNLRITIQTLTQHNKAYALATKSRVRDRVIVKLVDEAHSFGSEEVVSSLVGATMACLGLDRAQGSVEPLECWGSDTGKIEFEELRHKPFKAHPCAWWLHNMLVEGSHPQFVKLSRSYRFGTSVIRLLGIAFPDLGTIARIN